MAVFGLLLFLCPLSLLTGGWKASGYGTIDSTSRKNTPSYSIVEANYIGMNYTENLLDMRNNITSYTHLGAESNNADAWHLHFPDDAARLLEGVAWEADFSPVVRLELARRLSKGLMGSHVPGTQAYYNFRHRIGGKTESIFASEKREDGGRLMLSNLGDYKADEVMVGFSALFDNQWHSIDEFTYLDDPEHGGSPNFGRSAQHWNRSPFTFQRSFMQNGNRVVFNGKYWMSDEDMPFLFHFYADSAQLLDVIVGEENNPIPLLASGDGRVPGIITFPDGTSFQSAKDGHMNVENPTYNYLILRKDDSWAAKGYASALLVMWEGKAESVYADSTNGYGNVHVRFNNNEREGADAKVWLYPFPILNQNDMRYVARNAEWFLRHGKLLTNTFPPQQMLNAIPVGLAAGAYMLSKYKDPTASTVLTHAMNSVDQLFEAELKGRKLTRVFFPIRASAWLVKTAELLGNRAMADKYAHMMRIWLERMLSAESGYDGNGWPGGWDHFNASKAVWLAYDATGDPDLKAVFDRAMSVYTIDEDGIYRYGHKMEAPGGFETYFGSMPFGVWGLAGDTEMQQALLGLAVPAEPGSKVTVADMWHAAGNGPWAQDDANPEYVGSSLKGLNIPRRRQYLIPVGAFPTYDERGTVAITGAAPIDNPFFMPGVMAIDTIENGYVTARHQLRTQTFLPDGNQEKRTLIQSSGTVQDGIRICRGNEPALTYCFDIKDAVGAGLDFEIEGDGFAVDVSPNGERWFRRLDTWTDTLKRQSVDISFLTGNTDELVKREVIVPGNDSSFLVDAGGSVVTADSRRVVNGGHGFVYKIDLQHTTNPYLEVFLGNACSLELSEDGKIWHEVSLSPKQESGDGSTWIHMVDVRHYLDGGKILFVKVQEGKEANTGEVASAFLKRLTLYAAMKSEKVFVRLSNVSTSESDAFGLKQVVLRTWK